MSGRFVRASKYRHVYGQSAKKDKCYDNLHVSENAWDSNFIKVNPKYLSVNWQASGGGAFAVIPLNETGRLPERIPLFRGHKQAVLDTDWNPFNDNKIASGSSDGKICLWDVPENHTIRPDPEALDSIEADLKPAAILQDTKSKKAGHVLFNPAAENVLATTSDNTMNIWDVGTQELVYSFDTLGAFSSLSWSANGSLLATTSKFDKKDPNRLKIWDPRQQKAIVETVGHGGAGISRCVWLGELDQIATTGFSKFGSNRQLALWDIRSMNEPVDGFKNLGQASGVNMPFWDDSTKCLYTAGRGDGKISYWELDGKQFHELDEYSSEPQRGVGFMPKRGVNLHENELMRAYKVVSSNTFIEPVSFIVPRKSDAFQDDIYPPTTGVKPAMTSAEWKAGKEAIPPKISMESLFDGQGLKETSGVQDKPTGAVDAPAHKKAEPAPQKAEPAPLPTREPVSEPTPAARPAASMKDQGASMAAMVNKFADNQEDEAETVDDDDSSFEEVPKPAERAPRSPAVEASSPQVSSPLRPKQPESKPEPKPEVKPEPRVSSTATPTPSSPASESTIPTSAVHQDISEIKHLIAEQTKTIASQAQQMQTLAAEIESLKAKLN
ncbi:actin-binding protein [Penicillium argentinense]|uniref:Coronin n=1 Tax=Penicillium argentinense TaxID=1131581 RepID=A0A9W9FLS3_9EURO|nr:actin-binding protein [Penicillium argentinense]KAJ5102514.1 actin-binding protein [Penicillium argentinense]